MVCMISNPVASLHSQTRSVGEAITKFFPKAAKYFNVGDDAAARWIGTLNKEGAAKVGDEFLDKFFNAAKKNAKLSKELQVMKEASLDLWTTADKNDIAFMKFLAKNKDPEAIAALQKLSPDAQMQNGVDKLLQSNTAAKKRDTHNASDLR